MAAAQATPPLQAGFLAYQQYCNVCHGADLQGALPGVSRLVGVTDRMGEDAIKAVVTGGKGQMRPVSSITDAEMTPIIAYLAQHERVGWTRAAAASDAAADRRRRSRQVPSSRAAARRSRRCRRVRWVRSIRASAATPATRRIRRT